MLFSSPQDEIDAALSTAQQNSQSNVPQSSPEEDIDFEGQGTLASLVGYNQNLECAIAYLPNEYENEIVGTYFVSGNQVRGDFVIESQELGEQIVTSFIQDSLMLYIWSDIGGVQYGTKIAVKNAQVLDSNQPIPVNAEVTYDCKPWELVDGGVFIPPATVLFKDALDLQDAGMEYGTVYEEGEF